MRPAPGEPLAVEWSGVCHLISHLFCVSGRPTELLFLETLLEWDATESFFAEEERIPLFAIILGREHP